MMLGPFAFISDNVERDICIYIYINDIYVLSCPVYWTTPSDKFWDRCQSPQSNEKKKFIKIDGIKIYCHSSQTTSEYQFHLGGQEDGQK